MLRCKLKNTEQLKLLKKLQCSICHERSAGEAMLHRIPGIGMAETRTQHDGRQIVTIYPKMLHRKKKIQLPNLYRKLMKEEIAQGKESKFSDFYRTTRVEASKRLPSITDECVQGLQYYFEDGLRKVRPYYLVLDKLYKSKGKSDSPRLIDFMQKMFPYVTRSWLEHRIANGFIQVNMEPTTSDHELKDQDFVSNLIHNHESPVLDWPIDIIHDDADVLVVNKPPSFVTYPVSGYRMNSLIYILKAEHDYHDLRPVHRLDKLTSGVLIFGKNLESASKLSKILASEHTKKEYLALVDGEFPEGQVDCNEPLSFHYINVKQDIREYQTDKQSSTVFKRLNFDGQFSLVSCSLKTGRTHQIRQHLNRMGFHIVNDDIYNPKDRYQVMRSLNESDFEKSMMLIKSKHPEKVPGDCAKSFFSADFKNILGKEMVPSDCLSCTMGSNYFRQNLTQNSNYFMCLHAWKYTFGDGRIFEAPMPRWVTDKTMLKKILEMRKARKI